MDGLLDQFIDYLHRRRRAPVTIRKRRAVIARLLTEIDPYTATLFDLDEWVHTHWTADESLNAAVSGLRGFFRWMHASGRRQDNPAAELETVTVERRPARIATDTDILAGIANADPETEMMIRLAAECGRRITHDQAIVHNSWGRSAADIRRKIRTWGHGAQLSGWRYYATRWLPAPIMWRRMRSFHPLYGDLWPRLAPVTEPFGLHP